MSRCRLGQIKFKIFSMPRMPHLPLANLTRVLVPPQEPGRIEYYNQLFCLYGHLGVCLRFKPHWMFQIYKCVINGKKN